MSQPNGPQSSAEGSRSTARDLRLQRYKLYGSYALSSWGDRMWAFAVALALALIGDNLRLPALSGFVSGTVVLIFGASVGRWIDRMPRLRAATKCLLINNTAVAIASGMLVAMLYFEAQLQNLPAAYYSLLSGAVIFTAISQLASSGSKIVITRDWVIVMCRSDKDLLANMNAVMLRIDLTAMIISPLIAGQLMTSINMAAGCLFISAWNIGSYFAENYLLWSIYKGVPDLANKKAAASKSQKDAQNSTSYSDEKVPGALAIEKAALITPSQKPATPDGDVTAKIDSQKPLNCWNKIVKAMTSALKGWSLYRNQKAFEAGLALGLLYMTVLGLDAITTAFAYEQGLKENILAAVRGVGAIVGISGSFVFPKLRSLLGLPKTGIVSLVLQLSCLSLAVISIWLPGSPFDINGYISGSERTTNCSTIAAPPVLTALNSSMEVLTSSDDNNKSDCSVISIWVFLCGVVLARFGLWMADLSISQIYQETVTEGNRGVISGVQHSLNQSMDMLKNILVILLPDHRTFGLLIIASFAFVFSGFISFSTYAWRTLRLGGGEQYDESKIGHDVDGNDVAVPVASIPALSSDTVNLSETALDELAWQEGSLC